ncbi:MAG: mannose-1-phosphate guanylyltransferase/mannose-6-phosphate isomerase [Chlamydiota bacterium]
MKAFILAGGSGSRLWPLSRENYPKQFLRLKGTDSLLQKTTKRMLELIPPEKLFILTTDKYLQDVKSQVDKSLHANIILEPSRRNTAPAIALALKYAVDKRGAMPDDVILVMPADHFIEPEHVFLEAVKKAAFQAKQGKIVTFGIEPTRAETGFGYIKKGAAIDNGHFKVDSFVEKPDQKTAEEYVKEGNYLWNGGMFAFTVGTMLGEMETYCPEITGSYEELAAKFAMLPNQSLDYGVLEKSAKMAVLPLSLSWSDVGSWENIYDIFEKDADENVKVGNIIAHNCKNSLFLGGKKLITALDVEDLMVIETDDALLLCKRGSSQHVKQVVQNMMAKGLKEVLEHTTVQRPWGSYSILEEGSRYKIKKIVVNQGERLSLQKHYHRSEHWVVVKGTAKVTVNEGFHYVHENESIFVPKGAVHRVENEGKIPLEIIEVQVGEYLGEDDIIRLEDHYGRR